MNSKILSILIVSCLLSVCCEIFRNPSVYPNFTYFVESVYVGYASVINPIVSTSVICFLVCVLVWLTDIKLEQQHEIIELYQEFENLNHEIEIERVGIEE